VLKVSEAEADVVRRVFTEYANGKGLGAIASALNEAGVPAPYDQLGYEKRAGRGWAKTQVRSMLRNERYLGVVIWNKREFFRDPVTKKRRSRQRPEKEWIRNTVSELRVVSDDLWHAAQEKHRTHRKNGCGGRPHDAAARPHLLTGLLRCGTCGANMSVVGVKKKNGRSYPSLGCSANRSKGDVICPNARTVSEKQADAAVLQGLIEYVESGAFAAWLDEVVRAEEAARRSGKPPEVVELEADVRKQEARVEKVGRTLLDVGVSDYLRAALRQEEDKLRGLRQQLAAAIQRQPAPGAKLDVARVAAVMRNLSDVAASDPAEARRVMAEVVESVVLRFTEDGPEAEVTLKNETAAIAGGRLSAESTGCGGLHQRIASPSRPAMFTRPFGLASRPRW
jgi:hypothetical protein